MGTALIWIVAIAVFVPFLLWLTVSPILVIYWQIDPNAQRRFESRHEWFIGAAYIGALMACVYILTQGIEAMLVFIPESWGGYDEDGEWVTSRNSIAFMLAIIASFAIGSVFERHNKLRAEHMRLKIDLQIKEGRAVVAGAGPEQVKKMIQDYEIRTKELYDLKYTDYLSESQEVELKVKSQLLIDLCLRKSEHDRSL